MFGCSTSWWVRCVLGDNVEAHRTHQKLEQERVGANSSPHNNSCWWKEPRNTTAKHNRKGQGALLLVIWARTRVGLITQRSPSRSRGLLWFVVHTTTSTCVLYQPPATNISSASASSGRGAARPRECARIRGECNRQVLALWTAIDCAGCVCALPDQRTDGHAKSSQAKPCCLAASLLNTAGI